MLTCNQCGGYSETGICPSCKRNEQLSKDIDDNQRRLQSESIEAQERLQRESIEEHERLQRESIEEHERLQRESLQEQKKIQDNADVNRIRAKMLDFSLLALSDEKKAKLGAELLLKSRSFNDHMEDLYDDVTNCEFLSDCFFEIHFAKFINFNESDWGEGLGICYEHSFYYEYDGLIENNTNILRFKVLNNLYDDLEYFFDYTHDLVHNDLLAWLKRHKDIARLDKDPDILIDQLMKFREQIYRIKLAENEKEQVKSRKGAMRAKGSRHPDNVRSIIESLIFIAAGYVTFSYNSHSVYNLMGVDFSHAPIPVLASTIIAFSVCTLFFKNFSWQNPLSSRYNNIGIYYLWLGSSLTIFLLAFWKELSPNYRLATMGALLIAPAIPKINALLSAICRASILGFIAFFVSKILGYFALIVFGYIVNHLFEFGVAFGHALP